MARATRLAAVLLAAALAAGCGSETESYLVGTGRWDQTDVQVESRPAPPRAGNNEVVVMLTADHGRPVYDALVWVRAQPQAEWVQAIEDGHVGVYRRAVNFGTARDARIEVQLRRGNDSTVLGFPVKLHGEP